MISKSFMILWRFYFININLCKRSEYCYRRAEESPTCTSPFCYLCKTPRSRKRVRNLNTSSCYIAPSKMAFLCLIAKEWYEGFGNVQPFTGCKLLLHSRRSCSDSSEAALSGAVQQVTCSHASKDESMTMMVPL